MSVIDSSDPSHSEHRKKMDKVAEDKIAEKQTRTFGTHSTREQQKTMQAKNEKERLQQLATSKESEALNSELTKLWRQFKVNRIKIAEFESKRKEIFKKYNITSQEKQDLINRHFKH